MYHIGSPALSGRAGGMLLNMMICKLGVLRLDEHVTAR
jgi:hypothetical protein